MTAFMGFKKGELYVIGSSMRPSTGKSVLTENILAELARVRGGTMVFNAEINPKKVEQQVNEQLKIQPSQSGFLIGSTRL